MKIEQQREKKKALNVQDLVNEEHIEKLKKVRKEAKNNSSEKGFESLGESLEI